MAPGILGLALLVSVLVNLWALVGTWPKLTPPNQAELPAPAESPRTSSQPASRESAAGDEFARGLYRLLQKTRSAEGWTSTELVKHYEHSVNNDERLKVSDREAKAAIGTVSLLSLRSTARIESIIREALTKKGYDPELVNLACRRIRERFAQDLTRPDNSSN
jgi:hypothetical protein